MNDMVSWVMINCKNEVGGKKRRKKDGLNVIVV
jgi:hypothetical protein